ncbi:Nse4-domain-containing protein [Xylariaceae sp. FL0016]|nr:Nse4-domain-containing protein [Xylariaceae sp. FL0016]
MSSSPSPSLESETRESDSPPNRDSRYRTLAVRDKCKAPEGSSKRKRTMTNGTGPINARRRTREPEFINSGDESDESDEFDPDQPMEEKRKVQKDIRELLRGLNENNDEYLLPDSTGLHETVRKANAISRHVKQTTEATIDSKLLVNTADASYRKTIRLTSGNIAQGVDVDEFVSKCITYMRLGAGIVEDDAPELTATQQQRRRPGRPMGEDDDEDEIGDEGDMVNWEHLGRFACLPYARRPAVPGFLLGPLSVEKRVRKVVKRSARFRPGNILETRPEVLDAEDVQRNEKNDLTAICSKILGRLERVQEEAQERVADAIQNEGVSEDEASRLMDQYGLRDTGGIDLLRFVVNPRSFGQTVENMFYVSFLIRDGRVKIEFDDNQLPTLLTVPQQEEGGSGARNTSRKQQAVLSIDMQTWKDIIDAFNISEPIIEHRKEQAQQTPGARGWYS